MTEFKTDISENGKKFELVFQTDNKAYFAKMQATARECIDHKPDGFCSYGERKDKE